MGNFEATWVIWLIFATVFAIAEIFTHGFFIFWFAVGAGAAAAVAAFEVPAYWPWITFVLVTLICGDGGSGETAGEERCGHRHR